LAIFGIDVIRRTHRYGVPTLDAEHERRPVTSGNHFLEFQKVLSSPFGG